MDSATLTQPFFSVLILHWKGAVLLQRCLKSLASQTFSNFEVILVDNGSKDFPASLPEYIQQPVKVFHLPENLGFAEGNNFAAKHASGKYLVLLNNDAYPFPDWLAILNRAALSNPGHFFASRLLKASDPNILDGEWNVYHASGLAWRKNHGSSVSKSHLEPREVLSACAAAAAYPRHAFDSVGGFDEDFFAYMEDLDLDLRLQGMGHSCLYLPEALVAHEGSASTSVRSSFALFHGHRNMVWTFIKNMPGIALWLLMPFHLLANLAYLFASFVMPGGKALRQGKLAALLSLNQAFQKRKQVQKQRKVSAWTLLRKMSWNPLAPLVKLGFR